MDCSTFQQTEVVKQIIKVSIGNARVQVWDPYLCSSIVVLDPFFALSLQLPVNMKDEVKSIFVWSVNKLVDILTHSIIFGTRDASTTWSFSCMVMRSSISWRFWEFSTTLSFESMLINFNDLIEAHSDLILHSCSAWMLTKIISNFFICTNRGRKSFKYLTVFNRAINEDWQNMRMNPNYSNYKNPFVQNRWRCRQIWFVFSGTGA